MSIHPSLNISDKDKQQRSVLKRIERIKLMKDKEQWKEGDDVFGLPKIKTLRIKIKKEKAEKATDATAAPGAAASAPAAPAQASSKAPAAKGQEKK
ncbi:MAG: small basic protein [Candidatus Omnitrophota bacterium]|nr:small basic protein [Candidatus Omnitrophota bacterium]MBU1929096.1 small basic protein [Candidatus Omnitrophota bacterium]MBU1929153.1 small basic protein [Candidatus Omnitrophota bacterium]MBU2035033.1 small basic protein [Candidatus Omnitrophota bacterium]MBU2222036.1 small basic protein [Candidatus Omnitrophota bacterium]